MQACDEMTNRHQNIAFWAILGTVAVTLGTAQALMQADPPAPAQSHTAAVNSSARQPADFAGSAHDSPTDTPAMSTPPMGWLADEAPNARLAFADELPAFAPPAGPNQPRGPPQPMFGWLGEVEAARARAALAPQLPALQPDPATVKAASGRVVRLPDLCKLANGGAHLRTYRQEIGDCVSFGVANAISYSLAAKIVCEGNAGRFEELFQPYIYGISRVQIGGRHSMSDGSTGAWAAAGVQRYGIVSRAEPNCPPYSGSIAKKWGYSGPPDEWIAIGSKYKCEARLVDTWDALVDAIANGWGVAVCSGQGFTRIQIANNRVEGIASGSWAHCMAFIAVDCRDGREAVYCLNSWGETAHAKVDDYKRTDGMPPGGFWVLRATAERMLRSRDTYAYSFGGFRRQNIFPILESMGALDHERDLPESVSVRRAVSELERTFDFDTELSRARGVRSGLSVTGGDGHQVPVLRVRDVPGRLPEPSQN